MRSTPYWLDTAPAFQSGADQPVEGRFDVAVIGAGFTGLSTALRLARQGVSVLVLDAGPVIGEASGRNGGQCNTGLAHDYAKIIQTHGRDTAMRFHQAYSAAVADVERLVIDENIDCDFRRCGKLKLAAKPRHYENLAAAHRLMNDGFDAKTELFDAARVRDEIGSAAFHGALLMPDAAQLHVGRFGVGIAEAAARHGATIHENTPLLALDRHTLGFELRTPTGRAVAEQVVLATGTSRVGPLGWFRRRIVPVGSFILVTAPLPASTLDTLLPARRNYVTSRVIGHYFRVTSDRRLLFGGRARFSMSDARADRKAGAVLRHNLCHLFPSLAETAIDYCWGGLVDMSRDRLPRAGSDRGLHYAMGYSGHGVQMSVYMGGVIAERVTGEADRNPWAGLNWPAIPGHFGTPWFLPAVGAWYQLKDRFR
ncbi:FAD-binding oxidoreductase [Salinisphaera sp. Q1T1-3]|uniref:NAD(P)/FAD-dependent oxidoreductase n=1 Tax=Salinisphaera sp. Q1T1-3 TaxID=2321229 RepID=UPI000E719A14|nr:FAD-binding oxidoreductase [Salinisphaera sp. Q1T1-3]RJS91838.1 FAD-binding oxidoreductase [Salinisphaera sp. Q1T1-3]